MTVETFADYDIEVATGRSGEVDALCPKCSDGRKREHRNHKCLSVNTDDGTWYCHNCGWKGALRSEGERDWREPKRKSRVTVYAKLRDEGGEVGEEVLAWFAGRGIGEGVVRRNRIRANNGVIEFPYYVGGNLVNVKYRRMPKGFRMVKDADLVLYGVDDCDGAEEIVFVEGEPDKLAIEEATGRLAVVSVPNGAKSDLDVLASAEQPIEHAKRFVLAGDMDGPGRELMGSLAARLGYERCALVSWPEGCKDANDTLVECGKDVVAACLADAAPYPVAGIFTISDIADEIEALYESGMPAGAGTGWPTLDWHYTVREGQLTVVTGMPGSGKSVWLDALLVNLATIHGWRFGVCSPEQRPLARHSSQIIQKWVGKPFGAGPTTRMTRDEMRTGMAWVGRHFEFVLPEENTIDAVIERAKVLSVRSGIKGFVLDPWTELDHSRPSNQSETEFIHASLAKLRAFGINHSCHVWVVAHPTKLQKGSDGEYPVATLYDIAGSAGWFNKADNGLSIYRDKKDESKPTQIHVQKIRFHEVGGLGMVELFYDKPTGRYVE
jgi:twinkle protein